MSRLTSPTTVAMQQCDMKPKELEDMVRHSSIGENSEGGTVYSYKTRDEEIAVNIDKYIVDSKVIARLDTYRRVPSNETVFSSKLDRKPDRQEVKMVYHINAETMEIKLVYTGAGKGICTRAVAYTMAALLTYINGFKFYALRGYVYILSENPCAAFNCYNRAFRMNGFQMSKLKEFRDFQREYELLEADDGISYKFSSYTNEKQRLLKRQNELKEEGVKVAKAIDGIKKLPPKLKF